MDTTKHEFIVDGDEDAFILVVALDRALHELESKTGLTITVNDVTIERNPHGRGMWTYTLKAIK